MKFQIHLSLLLLLGLSACGEEKEPEPPPPPNEPQILNAKAQCRPVGLNNMWTLDSFELQVRDMDGIPNLRTPLVQVLASRLDLQSEEVPWMPGCESWCAEIHCQTECEEECEEEEGCLPGCLGECQPECLEEICPEACGTDSCEIFYRWNWSPESEQLLCGGEEDLDLEIKIEVKDTEGYKAEAFLSPSAL